jgi:hypothetical protein
LLCILLLRLGPVSAHPSRAIRRGEYCFLLRELRCGERFRLILRRLARERPHQHSRVVDSVCCSARCFVRPDACSRCRLDHCIHLDGHSMHSECAAMQSYPLPLYRTVLPRDDRAGARPRLWCHVCGNLQMDRVGCFHSWGKQTHLVGDRTYMGQVLIDGRSSGSVPCRPITLCARASMPVKPLSSS